LYGASCPFLRRSSAQNVCCESAVDHPAEVLREPAEEQRIDAANRPIDVDLDPCSRVGCRRLEESGHDEAARDAEARDRGRSG